MTLYVFPYGSWHTELSPLDDTVATAVPAPQVGIALSSDEKELELMLTKVGDKKVVSESPAEVSPPE